MPLEFPHGDRIIHHENALATAGLFGHSRKLHLGQPAAHQQAVDRTHEIVHVDDQHGVAVLEQRCAVDVGHLAKPRVERADLQIALAEKGGDDHAELLAAVADHDHRQGVVGHRHRRYVQIEDLRSENEADRDAVAIDVLAALHRADVVTPTREDLVDAGERKGVGLADDVDQQRPDHRHGDRQLQREDRLPAGLRCHPHAPADSFRHALHHIQPHSPSGDL